MFFRKNKKITQEEKLTPEEIKFKKFSRTLHELHGYLDRDYIDNIIKGIEENNLYPEDLSIPTQELIKYSSINNTLDMSDLL